MKKIAVWTKQNKGVLAELVETGRYITKKEYIALDLQEHAALVLDAYDWLVRHGPKASSKPKDVTYPIWVSYASERTMLPDQNSIILELAIDPELITPVHISKWGTILNYSYIPSDPEDAKRHAQLLADYGVNDAKAYMSQFYPTIKQEIISSWDRLFDETIQLGNDSKYGTIWEIKKEWITNITR